MSVLVILLVSALILVLAYRFYGSFLAAKVLTLSDTEETPAHKQNDGKDYVPMNKWIVFGHHFAAIAGAGPLVGPVLAAQFGYLPGLLWILIGAVLAGAVHDMVILYGSTIHGGKSLSEIARREIGQFSSVVTGIGVFFLIILTMAGLGLVVVNALFKNPWGVFTIGMTIPIAIFIGIYLRYLRPGKIGEASVIGVVMILLAVVLGPVVKASPLAAYLTISAKTLEIMLPAYGFLAAALPVWLLLAPRDYLSSYMKIGTITALALGIIIVHPPILMPALTKFIHGGGPIIGGKVWPFISITIACGALSGFHALISSGTTSKILDKQKDIKIVGYGAMLTEAFVAIMALIAATTLVPADYFAINTSPEVFKTLGMNVVHLPQLSKLVGEQLAGRPGGAVTLAVGMANIFSNIGGLRHLMNYWYQFAIMFEALFVLTTIDAGTRVARYIAQDLLGLIYEPIRESKSWVLSLILSAVVSFTWGTLMFGGDIKTIWPVFGVSNQAIAAVAFVIGTTMILKHSPKKIYALTTFLPMIYVYATIYSAGIQNLVKTYLPKHQSLPAFLVGTMLILATLILIDALTKWYGILSGKKPAPVKVKKDLNLA